MSEARHQGRASGWLDGNGLLLVKHWSGERDADHDVRREGNHGRQCAGLQHGVGERSYVRSQYREQHINPFHQSRPIAIAT